jgi:aminoglycoside 3-N-acetyltransferase
VGAAKAVKFGDADCILCEARKVFEVCAKFFAIEETCIIERDEIPETWWKE